MRSTTLSAASTSGTSTRPVSPGGLALDEVEHLVAVGVLELLGLEVGRQATRRAASAIASSLAESSALSTASNSRISAGSLTSSAYTIVDSRSLPSFGRMAHRYCFERITNRAMPTLPVSSMARASRAYGLAVALSGAT